MIAGGEDFCILTMLDFFEIVNVLFRPQNTAKKGEKTPKRNTNTLET